MVVSPPDTPGKEIEKKIKMSTNREQKIKLASCRSFVVVRLQVAAL